MSSIRKIAVLTSGGDAPGMNAAVSSVARFAVRNGIEVVGVKRGWRGMLFQSENPEDDMSTLDLNTWLDIADTPGTYLRTARCDEWVSKPDEGYDAAPLHKAAAKRLREEGVEGLVVIGGDGTFQGAKVLRDDAGEYCLPFVGIPGTIDNDLGYTESTIGFDTAVNVCVESVRSIRACSRSHERPAVVQVMGRNCGDIAMRTAMATGAEMVVVPEMHWDCDQIADRINFEYRRGNTRATLIIAENCFNKMKPFDWRVFLNEQGKHVGDGEELTSERLASILKRKCNGVEVRATVLGYVQRGAIPSAFDCFYAFQAGRMAVDLLMAGDTNKLIGLNQGRVYAEEMDRALSIKRSFDLDTYNLINRLKEDNIK